MTEIHPILQLEKQRQNSHLIYSLTNIGGNTVTDTNDMLDVIHGFVKDLFSCVETNNIAMNNILECVNVAVDNDDDVEMCDEDITVDEICKSLSGMSKSKTPGPDGITAEFYLYFINDLQNVLLYIFNSIDENEELSRSMKHSIINLIYKNKGDKTDLKFFRPIRLLNVDYKILARIMSNRLTYVLPKIISPTQSCCV